MRNPSHHNSDGFKETTELRTVSQIITSSDNIPVGLNSASFHQKDLELKKDVGVDIPKILDVEHNDDDKKFVARNRAKMDEIIDKKMSNDPNDENIAAPKMNTLVGFIRFGNFLSATTVIFLLVLNWFFLGKREDSVKSYVLPEYLVYVQATFLCLFVLTTYIDR